MPAPLDLAALEIFRAVAAESSVTRAAQRLARVQSNVTTRLKQLEDDVGAELFLRDGKRMVLTPVGDRLLGYAEQLLALAEEARQAVQPRQPSGRLRIGAMESTAASRLPRPFAEYHQRWPEVALEVSTGTTCALLDALVARTLDCALVADPAAMAPAADAHLPSGLEALPVYTEALRLLLPPGHPPVERAEQIGVRTLAGFARGCVYRHIGEHWLNRTAQPAARGWQVLEVGSYHAILACVAAGSCIAVVPQSVLDLHAAPGQMTVQALAEVDTLLVKRRGYRSAAYDAFAELLSPAQPLRARA